MHDKSLKFCGFTLIMGIFGAFFRWAQGLSAYETDTGLAVSGSLWSYILLGFLIINALSLIFSVRRFRKESFPLEFSKALQIDLPLVKITGFALAAVMAIGGLISLLSAITAPFSVFDAVKGAFAIICAICFAVFISSPGRDHAKARGGAAGLIIVLFYCFWLIASYKSFASEPVIWRFAPKILAICAAILGYYFVVGYPYGKPKPMLCLYFCQLGAFLLIVTLADPFKFGEQLITLSAAGGLLFLSYAIVSSGLNQKTGK